MKNTNNEVFLDPATGAWQVVGGSVVPISLELYQSLRNNKGILNDLLCCSDDVEIDFSILADGSRDAYARQIIASNILDMPMEVRAINSGIFFRLVPAGSFMMGSPVRETNRENDEVLHEVTLTRAFYVGKYEVTQGEWERVMASNPSSFKEAGARAPVERVSWEDCQEFLRKLCLLEGVPNGTYRLLTEAEWEYACRAGTSAAFCYGDSLPSRQANFDGNYPYGGATVGPYLEKPVSVGSYMPNAWGLYDFHGNVSEWCADWHSRYSGWAEVDPAGPAAGVYRVSRGGSWYSDAWLCRAAYRFWGAPGNRYNYLGLRLARTI